MSDIDPDFLKIDELRLDKECLRQPELYFQFAEELADAKRDLDEAQTDLKVIEAELALDIRKDPESYKLDKVTEASVAAAIPLQKEYKDQQVIVRKKRHRVDVLTGAIVALEHKKRSLTLLVNLHGQNYFADPIKGSDERGRAKVAEDGKKAVRSVGRLKRERDEDEEDDES